MSSRNEQVLPNHEEFDHLTRDSDEAGGAGRNGVVPTVEERMRASSLDLARTISGALFPPTDAPTESAHDPFRIALAEALAPLRANAIRPLLARFDQAIAAEITLRVEFGRLEYRAVVAEKAMRKAEERLAEHEERRVRDESVLREVVAELESQLDDLRAENARLQDVVNRLRSEDAVLQREVEELRSLEVSTTDENRHLREVIREVRDQQGRLQEDVAAIAASRWIRVGTRLGLSKLKRHLQR